MEVSEYKTLLSRHDWTYEYSDNYATWVRGNSEMNELRKHSTDSDEHKRLFMEYKHWVTTTTKGAV